MGNIIFLILIDENIIFPDEIPNFSLGGVDPRNIFCFIDVERFDPEALLNVPGGEKIFVIFFEGM